MMQFLRKLNSMPYEAAMRHFYPLTAGGPGKLAVDLTKPEGWDAVRSTAGNFYMPTERGVWQRMCETPIAHDSGVGDLPSRAYCILDLLQKKGFSEQLISFGVGLGALEYHLKRLKPELQVYCSDFNDEAVQRLRTVFNECDGIYKFDLMGGSYREVFPRVRDDALLMIHRMDPHLADEEWVQVFERLATGRGRNILFVPHRLLTLRYLFDSKRRELVHRCRRTPLALSGTVRTFHRWLKIWGRDYELVDEPRIGYSRGFLLKLRNNAHS